MKKLISLAMVIILVLSMSTTAFAQPFEVSNASNFTMEINLTLDNTVISITAEGISSADTAHMKGHMNLNSAYIPFSAWSDEEAVIIEVPFVLQFLMALENPSLARPFWIIERTAESGETPVPEALGQNRYRMVLSNEAFIVGDWVSYFQLDRNRHVVKAESNAQFALEVAGNSSALDFGYIAEFEILTTAPGITLPLITPENSAVISGLFIPPHLL